MQRVILFCVLVISGVACNSSKNIANDYVFTPVENIDFIFERFIEDLDMEKKIDPTWFTFFNLSVDTVSEKTFFKQVFKSYISATYGNYVVLHKDAQVFLRFITTHQNLLLVEPNLYFVLHQSEQEDYLFLVDRSKNLSLNHCLANFNCVDSVCEATIQEADFLKKYEATHLEKPLFVVQDNQVIFTPDQIKINYAQGKIIFSGGKGF